MKKPSYIELEKELYQVKQLLQETMEKYSTAFYKSSVAKALTSFPDGVVFDINQSMVELLGYTLDEIKGKSTTEIGIWNDLSERDKFVYNLANNIPVRNFEIHFQNKFGEYGTYLLSSEIITIQGDQYLLSNFIDIGYQKKVEERLKESELRWQFSVDGSGLGLWDWNIKTNEVFFSEQWKKMLGFEDHEISNKLEEWDTRVHPDDKEQAYKDINMHMEGKTPLYYNEHRLLCKDGSYKWIQDRGRVLARSEDGKALRMIGTHTDIDVQKRIQEEYSANLAKFRLLFEQSPLGIYIANKEGNILEGNLKLLELLGSPSIEATKKINVLTFPQLVEKGYSKIFKKCIETGENQYVEMDYTSRWGKHTYLASYIVPLYNKQEQLQHVFTLMEDITERKEAEQELLKSNATKDKLFSIIAHDLRGPIGTINTISEALSHDKIQDETTRATFLDSLHEISENTFYLLQNLLNWARLNRENIEFKPVKLDVNSLLKHSVEAVKFKASSKQISIHTDFSEEKNAFADEEMIKLVVRNLVENAVKFTKPQGIIQLRTYAEEVDYIIEISNTGEPITEEALNKIYSETEFYTTFGTGNETGSGLGLKLVKEFVEKNNGKFDICKLDEDKTCVSFTLPIYKVN